MVLRNEGSRVRSEALVARGAVCSGMTVLTSIIDPVSSMYWITEMVCTTAVTWRSRIGILDERFFSCERA